MGGFSDFEPAELWALSQLCKRIDADILKALSKDAEEAFEMRTATLKLADLLGEIGYKPR